MAKTSHMSSASVVIMEVIPQQLFKPHQRGPQKIPLPLLSSSLLKHATCLQNHSSVAPALGNTTQLSFNEGLPSKIEIMARQSMVITMKTERVDVHGSLSSMGYSNGHQIQLSKSPNQVLPNADLRKAAYNLLGVHANGTSIGPCSMARWWAPTSGLAGY
ncbi:hypothetical protein VNO77_20325 [Canavalia gladiata]|uniref:Uncharacterized protein n=1 Tax=Canavalia gladiata TaxID=3824 RepID=A0AAN9LPD7_CANGL